MESGEGLSPSKAVRVTAVMSFEALVTKEHLQLELSFCYDLVCEHVYL